MSIQTTTILAKFIFLLLFLYGWHHHLCLRYIYYLFIYKVQFVYFYWLKLDYFVWIFKNVFFFQRNNNYTPSPNVIPNSTRASSATTPPISRAFPNTPSPIITNKELKVSLRVLGHLKTGFGMVVFGFEKVPVFGLKRVFLVKRIMRICKAFFLIFSADFSSIFWFFIETKKNLIKHVFKQFLMSYFRVPDRSIHR